MGERFPAQIKLMDPTPCIYRLHIKIALSDYPGGRDNTSHSRLPCFNPINSLFSVMPSPWQYSSIIDFSFWNAGTVRAPVRHSAVVPISDKR